MQIIHVAREGKELGVFSLEEINRQLTAGTLRPTDLAWYEGAGGWAALSTVPGVSAAPASAAPASAAPTSAAPPSMPLAAPPSVPAAPAGVVAPRKNEPLAVLSLILSIVSLCGFCCGFFVTAAVAGIVCGHLALSRIKANPELEGHGLALAGLIIGYVAVAGWLIWALLFGGLAVLQGIGETMTRH